MPPRAEGGASHKSSLDARILEALIDGPLPTTSLAERLGEDNALVYRRCCSMEIDGALESELVQGPRLLYCVDHKRVVTAEIFPTCKEEDHQFKGFYSKVRVWTAIAISTSTVRKRQKKPR